MQITLRIRVMNPPSGVLFRLQKGHFELLPPSHDDGSSIAFDFEMRVADRTADAPPRFLGPFTQGPPSTRFVYICSGKRAGQGESQWDRRAKVPLGGITWALIDEASAKRDAVLEAKIAGTGRDGGPACATVPLLGVWHMTR